MGAQDGSFDESGRSHRHLEFSLAPGRVASTTPLADQTSTALGQERLVSSSAVSPTG